MISLIQTNLFFGHVCQKLERAGGGGGGGGVPAIPSKKFVGLTFFR